MELTAFRKSGLTYLAQDSQDRYASKHSKEIALPKLTVPILCLVFFSLNASLKASTTDVSVELRGSNVSPRLPVAALAALGAHELRSHPSTSVVRIPRANLKALEKTAQQYGLTAIVHGEWDEVHLPAVTFDTTSAEERATTAPIALFVVQFDCPLAEEDAATLLSNNLTYAGYFPYNAVLAVGASSDAARVRQAPHVKWVSYYDPTFRAQPALSMQTGNDFFTIQLPNVSAVAATIDRLRAVSKQILAIDHIGPYVDVSGEFSQTDIQTFRTDPLVISAEGQGNYVLSGEREAIGLTTKTSTCTTEPCQDGIRPYKPAGGTDYRTWLSNRGVLDTSSYRIAIVDSGLGIDASNDRSDHPDLVRSSTAWTSYINEPSSDNLGHGTLVAGLAAGNPTSAPPTGMTASDSLGFLYGMGVAPQTSLFIQKVVHSDGSLDTAVNVRTLANDAYMWGCVVQNHSQNDSANLGLYTTRTQVFDFAVRDTYEGFDGIDTPMAITVSAGNAADAATDLRVGPPATAKNVISVGAAESWRSDFTSCVTGTRDASWFNARSFQNVATLSRRGTEDGRIKPDLIAPGTQISSTRTQYDPIGGGTPDLDQHGAFCRPTADGFYTIDSGTSFAAPQVAGAVVLLDRKRNANLSPAMLKAALVGGSLSVRGGLDGRGGTVGLRPNIAQGFGRLYLGDALSSQVTQTYLDENSWTPFTAAGQNDSRAFTIANTSLPTVVVLAWTDEPANVLANPTLVRDLDMEVATDVCHRYTGNQTTLGASGEVSRLQTYTGTCGGSGFTYDRLNNVEMIVIPPNTRSSFTLDIFSTTWGFGTHDQKFAVYASNAF